MKKSKSMNKISTFKIYSVTDNEFYDENDPDLKIISDIIPTA